MESKFIIKKSTFYKLAIVAFVLINGAIVYGIMECIK